MNATSKNYFFKPKKSYFAIVAYDNRFLIDKAVCGTITASAQTLTGLEY
jgi:hypothetical protein